MERKLISATSFKANLNSTSFLYILFTPVISSSPCSLVQKIGFISARKRHCQTCGPDTGKWATHLDTSFLLSTSENFTTNSSLYFTIFVEESHHYAFTNETQWLKCLAKGQMKSTAVKKSQYLLPIGLNTTPSTLLGNGSLVGFRSRVDSCHCA